jgi:membrane-associated phospholipid phosphatase
MTGRVFVGAHNPLDVISGAGAGLVVGGLVTALIL